MATQPYPDEQTWWPDVAYPAFDAEYRAVGRHWPDEGDPLCFVWPQRTAYDIAAGMTKEASLAKYIDQLHRQLNPQPTPIPPQPGAGLPPLHGDVALIDGGLGGIKDASGRRLAVIKHAGDFVARVINDPNGKTFVAQQLDYLVSVYVQVLRVWFFLPSEWWRTPPRPGNATPTDSRWEPAVRWLYEQCKVRGLYLQADGGDLLQFPQADRVRYAERWGVITRESGVGLFSIGVGNEGWQNGESGEATPDSVQRMTEVLQAFERGYGRRVGLSTLTSVRDEGLLNDYVRGTDAPTVISFHNSRFSFRHATERAWTAAYAKEAAANDPKLRDYLLDDEPCGVNSKDGPVGSGPGTHVSATNPSDMVIWRKLEAYGTYMAAHYIGRQTPTIFTSPGVVSDEPFSVYPHVAHVATIAALLPKDVQAWKHFHGGDGRDFSGLRILGVDVDDLVRCDHALNEETGDVVVVIYCTEPGSYRLPVVSGFEGHIITPDETLFKHPLTLTAGTTIDIAMEHGRILIGRRKS